MRITMCHLWSYQPVATLPGLLPGAPAGIHPMVSAMSTILRRYPRLHFHCYMCWTYKDCATCEIVIW